MTSHDGELLAALDSGLHNVNPTDASDISGDHGLIHAFPATMTDTISAMASFNGLLLVMTYDGSGRTSIWSIDRSSPSNILGGFGNLGQLAATVLYGTGLAGHTDGSLYASLYDGTSYQLVRININNLGDTTGQYGNIGLFDVGLYSHISGLTSHVEGASSSPPTMFILVMKG